MPVGALPFFTTDVVLLHFLQTTLIVAIMPPCTQIRKGTTKRQNKLSTVLIYDQLLEIIIMTTLIYYHRLPE